ncbi:hypothetical protein [Intrasporangium sp.]|uniref:hypothetical protein n=1 Tax=Intrasporangium sp. TaxID=1925024 RepID=UPI0029398D92|nr:hypothetical protein [Intrasporangium sp.]MDV3222193.1 hypothetical protein [Intrasporangium sp.]
MAPPPLSDLALVDDVHVRVGFDTSDGPDEIFLLDLHLDQPGPVLDDEVYLAALSPVVAVVDSLDGCVVRIGREHRLGGRPRSAVDVSVSLPRPRERADETDPHGRSEQHAAFEDAVAAALRSLIAEFPPTEVADLGRDEAMTTARRRLAEAAPSTALTALSVTAEEHVGDQWLVRLTGPGTTGFEVRLGFVDGHPGTTHLRRIRVGEVVDSVGT